MIRHCLGFASDVYNVLLSFEHLTAEASSINFLLTNLLMLSVCSCISKDSPDVLYLSAEDPSPAGRLLIPDACRGETQAAFRPDLLPDSAVVSWGNDWLSTSSLSVSSNPCAVSGMWPRCSPGWWCSWLACSSHSWSGTLVTWAGLQGQGCLGFGWWRLHWLPSGNCDSGSGVWGSVHWKSWKRTIKGMHLVTF